ncbi:MAG: rhodanese-like domain-containing protein [Acidobacteriota bacterium]
MRNTLLIVFVALGVAFAQQPGGNAKQGAKQGKQAKQEPKSKKLSRAEFDQLVATPSSVVIVDVRRPDEHSEIGAFPVFLSIQANDLEKYIDYIPKDRTVIAVSNHANRGLRAADLLADKGFKVAGAIGVQDYEEQGGTLNKITKPVNDGKGKGKQ